VGIAVGVRGGGGGFARCVDEGLSTLLLAGGAEVVEIAVLGDVAVVGAGELSQPVNVRPPMDSPIIVMRIAPE
jgi:hypothetical protein